MKFIMVEWIHDFLDEPIRIYSELDEKRNELRKIEIFRNGNIGFASTEAEFGGSRLSECPIPQIEEISSDPQFKLCEISKEEFETLWSEIEKS